MTVTNCKNKTPSYPTELKKNKQKKFKTNL